MRKVQSSSAEIEREAVEVFAVEVSTPGLHQIELVGSVQGEILTKRNALVHVRAERLVIDFVKNRLRAEKVELRRKDANNDESIQAVTTKRLLDRQRGDGSWLGPGGSFSESELIATNFALLFLTGRMDAPKVVPNEGHATWLQQKSRRASFDAAMFEPRSGGVI